MSNEEELRARLRPKTEEDMPISVGLRGCTKALFIDWRHQTTSQEEPPYTLKDYDHEYKGKIYKSMYLIYMECDSEYEAAIKLLGSWPHWCKLKKCSWFLPYFERWEEERNIRDAAIARSVLLEQTEGGNVTAARSVLTNSGHGSLAKNPKKPGRPEKGGKRDKAPLSDTLDSMLQSMDGDSDKRVQ